MRSTLAGATLLASLLGHLVAAQDPAPGPPLSAAEVFRKAAPSVVIVLAMGADGSVTGQGSGVVVAEDRVITNRHVVEGAARLRVHRDGEARNATLLYLDRERDLALLQAVRLGFPPAERRASETLEVGEHVFAVGAPQGLELSLSDGLVSGLKPRIGGQIVQTTAPISKGSSGGGLFDSRGRLVGITAFALRDAQNVNYALPADWIGTLEEFAARVEAESPEPTPDPGVRRVSGVRHETAPGQTRVILEADGPLGYDYSSPDPGSAVLQVFAASDDLPARVEIASPEVLRLEIAASEIGGRALLRVEVRLAAPTSHRVYTEGDSLLMEFKQ